MKDMEGQHIGLVEYYGRLPLSFEANHGQTDEQVRFLARAGGCILFLAQTEAVLAMKAEKSGARKENGVSQDSSGRAAPAEVKFLKLILAGANPQPQVAGVDALPGVVSYFKGNDPAGWRTGIPMYARVRYQEVYPGIDLVFYGSQGMLEHDFFVAPGADPGKIALDFEGADRIEIDSAGDLVVTAAGDEIRFQKPAAYQSIDGGRREVSAGFTISAGRRVGFVLGEYDAAYPVVIDPVLVYSTYLGGSGDDAATAIAVDGSGAAYVTGWTWSTDFPLQNLIQPVKGAYDDAFVTKFDPTGTSLVYSTYLGGDSGDRGYAIAVDGNGAAYVTGATQSTNFPLQNPLQAANAGIWDLFVTKISPAGTALVYSTYLGGSWSDVGRGIAVDGSGAVYLTGWTESENFPLKNPIQPVHGGVWEDAFITKINPEGTELVYSTFLGGSSNDNGYAIAVDGFGAAYLAGRTASTNFPLQNPIQPVYGGDPWDGFVTKINPAGSALVYSTYLGGSGDDEANGIAVDAGGAAYIAGQTTSLNFPLQNALQPAYGGGSWDAFVTKINAAGSALVYSTYLGGSGSDRSSSIAVSGSGAAYLTGSTDSTNFPLQNPLQPVLSHWDDVFVTGLTYDGTAFIYSTYLGGDGTDLGNGIALDAGGAVYIAGWTDSADFPLQNPFQSGRKGFDDAFVAKISAGGGGGGSVLNTVTVSGNEYDPVRTTIRRRRTLRWWLRPISPSPRPTGLTRYSWAAI